MMKLPDIASIININSNFNISSSLKHLSITGNSLSSSKVVFKYPINFVENIKDIELENLIIEGDLFFNNNKRIILDSVVLNGSIDSYFNNQDNEYIKFYNINYKPSETSNYNCINLSGNLYIENSIFYGSSKCNNRILHFDGLLNYDLIIENSKFDGGYECPCLSIEKTQNVIVDTTTFEKAISSEKIKGGYIFIIVILYSHILKINNFFIIFY